MKPWMRVLIAGMAWLLFGTAWAIAPRSFEDPAQQRQYEALLPELRCLVCQNETLADSEAPLAEDLRREVAEMVLSGHGSADIKDFLVARYGDFVLYRPTVKPLTYVLWFGSMNQRFESVISIAAGRRHTSCDPQSTRGQPILYGQTR